MPTDVERREVARGLRRLADKHDGVAGLIVERRLGLESDERFLAGSVFTSESVDRLADLIEPAPSCEFWDSEEQECYSVRTVRPVDRDALLALAEEIERTADFDTGLDPRVLLNFARRIREALGVKS